MDKEEFLIKAKEIGMLDSDIEFSIETVEELIGLGFPPSWEMWLIPPPVE